MLFCMGMELTLTLWEEWFLSFSSMRLNPVVFRLQVGPLYQPWMTDRMEHCWNDNWWGKIKVFVEKPALYDFVHYTFQLLWV